VIALCLSAGALSTTLSIHAFTLAWMHSVEKIRWEEEWRIEGSELHLLSANIRGFGAGMEPPLDAIFKNGAWHYDPKIAPIKRLTLAHSPYTKGYELCFNATCKPLSDFLPNIEETTTITLEACER